MSVFVCVLWGQEGSKPYVFHYVIVLIENEIKIEYVEMRGEIIRSVSVCAHKKNK